jgi:hypothetical protein
VKCERCGAELTEDGGMSWPYCPVCDWCPDCGVTHEAHPDARGGEEMDLMHWWDASDNMVTLTAWMADNGYSAKDVAYAVEKPWKYEDEFKTATAELEAATSATP